MPLLHTMQQIVEADEAYHLLKDVASANRIQAVPEIKAVFTYDSVR